MFLARAAFVFTDNVDAPLGAVGMTCDLGEGTPTQFTDTTIGDLLTAASVPWAWFYDGYAAMQASAPSCPPKPASCPLIFPSYPCALRAERRALRVLQVDGRQPGQHEGLQRLRVGVDEREPSGRFIRQGLGYENEHPGLNSTMSAGVTFATSVVSSVEASPYASSTLVLLVYDEGGGYFDHVSPPPANPLDNVPYGTRLPVLAIGPFARKNFVSHVVMEHSSIVKFIEWNWLGQQTGQLGTRDTVVNNIGSLLDPSTTGIPVPEN